MNHKKNDFLLEKTINKVDQEIIIIIIIIIIKIIMEIANKILMMNVTTK